LTRLKGVCTCERLPVFAVEVEFYARPIAISSAASLWVPRPEAREQGWQQGEHHPGQRSLERKGKLGRDAGAASKLMLSKGATARHETRHHNDAFAVPCGLGTLLAYLERTTLDATADAGAAALQNYKA